MCYRPFISESVPDIPTPAGVVAKTETPRRVLFELSLQNQRPVIGGRGTSAEAIIELGEGVNAAGAIEGDKPMADEAIIAAAPDMVVMMRRDGTASEENHGTQRS